MEKKEKRISFGPVPSRRLGQSMGINNIPPKICTYSCIYCQLGRTSNQIIDRKSFYTIEDVNFAVSKKIKEATEHDENIDYLTFVPDGEPTLDINLGREIQSLKSLKIKIAVITNSSLLWRKEVRDELLKADCVSLKIDAVNENIWKKIDRPHKSLKHNKILSGMVEFSRDFQGNLITETMLIKDLNNNTKELEKIADFISNLNPDKSYISIPIRPPAEKWAVAANEFNINIGYQFLIERGIDTEFLTGYEGNAFAFTGDVERDLLCITSVHPMREDGIKKFLLKSKSDWKVIEKLLEENKLVEINYKNKKFYIRNFQKKIEVEEK